MNQLFTSRGETLTGTPWQIYPRPQMRRNSYVNLNGDWEFGVGTNTFCRHYDKTIRVPFCPESALSGIGEHFAEGAALCYRRTFTLPGNFHKGRVLLHVGAADQHLYCFINDKQAGTHIGGYEAMTFDITDYLRDGENEIKFRCHDDLTNQIHPYGKQTLNRGGMWYTPVSGIWQTVWLESVPTVYVQKLNIENRGTTVTITTEPALDGKITVAGLGEFSLTAGSCTITPEAPHLWSPEDPYLYDFTLEAEEDRIESYFAIRTLETKVVNGYPRLLLNGKPYFFHGLLDQGYWPDGIFTPPAPECYADDILAMKELGFNMLRKHIKVEPEEFYYQCDKLGMIVFQDMVNNGDYAYIRDTIMPTIGIQKRNDRRMHADENCRRGFLDGMAATVNQLKNHPCILYWTIFNEAWGQFDSDNVYHQFKKLDDTRFIDSTSGWFRRKNTDVESLHIYFGPWSRLKATDKPLVLSEFGGHCYAVPDHLFNPDKAYGYKTCKTPEEFHASVEELYRTRIIPAVSKGLCATVYTQVSDVEDEINGLLTYDRKVCKADRAAMVAIAEALRSAMED